MMFLLHIALRVAFAPASVSIWSTFHRHHASDKVNRRVVLVIDTESAKLPSQRQAA